MGRGRVDALLAGGQQVEEQRREPGLAEHPGDVLIARAQAAAPAPVREDHHAARAEGDVEDAVQHRATGGDADELTGRGHQSPVG